MPSRSGKAMANTPRQKGLQTGQQPRACPANHLDRQAKWRRRDGVASPDRALRSAGPVWRDHTDGGSGRFLQPSPYRGRILSPRSLLASTTHNRPIVRLPPHRVSRPDRPRYRTFPARAPRQMGQCWTRHESDQRDTQCWPREAGRQSNLGAQ